MFGIGAIGLLLINAATTTSFDSNSYRHMSQNVVESFPQNGIESRIVGGIPANPGEFPFYGTSPRPINRFFQ